MATGRSTRKRSGAETFLGIAIPLALLGIAIYQAIHDHKVDRNIIGALLIFGLGSLGWRVDVILEKYLDSKRPGPPPPYPPQPPSE